MGRKGEHWRGESIFLGARIQGHILSQKGMVSFSEIKKKITYTALESGKLLNRVFGHINYQSVY